MGLFTLIRQMDTKKMRRMAGEVAAKSGKPRALVLADMVWCGFRYQAGYSDYAFFEMWDMNPPQRSSVLTRGKNNRYVHALNDPKDMRLFEEKSVFLETFAPYVRRRWLDLRTAGADELEAMAKDLGVVLVKPEAATHGDGVEKLYYDQVTDWPALHARLVAGGQTLCEEVIAQHPDLDRLWPGSINTIRLVTILKDGKAHVVASFLRVGNGEKPVDNFNNGGVVVPLIRETGEVPCAAVDKAGRRYETHPGTGTPFVGFQVPLWEEVMALVQEAANVVPGVRYVGWDVAVTPTGPVLVEGNQYPGHDIYGLPGQASDKIGILPEFEKVLPLRELGRG